MTDFITKSKTTVPTMGPLIFPEPPTKMIAKINMDSSSVKLVGSM